MSRLTLLFWLAVLCVGCAGWRLAALLTIEPATKVVIVLALRRCAAQLMAFLRDERGASVTEAWS